MHSQFYFSVTQLNFSGDIILYVCMPHVPQLKIYYVIICNNTSEMRTITFNLKLPLWKVYYLGEEGMKEKSSSHIACVCLCCGLQYLKYMYMYMYMYIYMYNMCTCTCICTCFVWCL